jgi:hypothetical protein
MGWRLEPAKLVKLYFCFNNDKCRNCLLIWARSTKRYQVLYCEIVRYEEKILLYHVLILKITWYTERKLRELTRLVYRGITAIKIIKMVKRVNVLTHLNSDFPTCLLCHSLRVIVHGVAFGSILTHINIFGIRIVRSLFQVGYLTRLSVSRL